MVPRYKGSESKLPRVVKRQEKSLEGRDKQEVEQEKVGNVVERL